MLNLKKLLTKMLQTPRVVESGTSGVWKYRKWSDGTYDAWLSASANFSSGTLWANGYYYHQTTSAYAKPSFAANIKTVAANANGSQLCMFCGASGSDTVSKTLYFLDTQSSARSSVPITVRITGEWS